MCKELATAAAFFQFIVIPQYFESETFNVTVLIEFYRTSLESHLLDLDVKGTWD
jgi:hypothetical protein